MLQVVLYSLHGQDTIKVRYSNIWQAKIFSGVSKYEPDQGRQQLVIFLAIASTCGVSRHTLKRRPCFLCFVFCMIEPFSWDVVRTLRQVYSQHTVRVWCKVTNAVHGILHTIIMHYNISFIHSFIPLWLGQIFSQSWFLKVKVWRSMHVQSFSGCLSNCMCSVQSQLV